ncbi:hypothetical protein UFOVP707_22 [uncultured Caudovirales phage]|uniref:Uncharacterized protein n=1 Tax=uncultured Caudovirales phage TaxID=2100421 RepID=A0A6J5NJ57_9CAUD|nr:hypothetical protein UFOVP707_22 [uncultured Caudovirales phage]
MQTIADKTARIIRAAKAAGLTADQARHLIHATGGSPRRARRILRQDPALATMLADTFKAAVTEGTPFVTAVRQANAAYLASMPATEGADGGEDEEAGE